MKIKLTEEELIIALQTRASIGAEALYDMYSSNLFKVIFSIVKHQELAEDTLQLTFMKVWHSFEQYHSQRGRLYTWMITIARNLSKDALRTKSYHNQCNSTDLDSVSVDVDKRHHTSINTDMFGIRESLNKLNKEHRQILDLIYFQGYTHVEAADELGIPLGTVKTRWSKGINSLRKMFYSDIKLCA